PPSSSNSSGRASRRASSCASRRRHTDRLQPRVSTLGAGLEAVEVGAGVGAGQIQYFAAELPVLLDLRFRLRGAPGELAVFPAGRRDGAHDFLEARMIELQMDPQGPAQVGVAIRDHVDALDGSDRVDVLQSLERLDRRAEDDVLVRPWGVFGLVAISVALVTRAGSHPGHPAAPEGWVLGLTHDRP